MSLLSSATVFRLVDSIAIVLAQAYQLARARLASAASPIVRLLVQRDHRPHIALHGRTRRENGLDNWLGRYAPWQGFLDEGMDLPPPLPR